jgi:outer membrane protein assembly factor BamA
MRGLFTLNTQERPRDRNVFFARIIPEWAGHPMFVPLRALGKESQDTTGAEFYTVGGIRYAEFVKLDTDLRWRRIIHEKSSMAFRVAAGAGLPYGNLPVLPFESSFFVGGANGLRAWRARSLGPGSYNAPLVAFDRIGEIRLEGNAEYRFKLVGFLEGAFFADIGNIWNWEEDERKPGSGFSSAFLSELAVGTGVGARLNFDFFIVRFDLGMQTKDPSLPPGERWLFQPKDEYEAFMLSTLGSPVPYRTQFNFNIGIGYPF